MTTRADGPAPTSTPIPTPPPLPVPGSGTVREEVPGQARAGTAPAPGSDPASAPGRAVPACARLGHQVGVRTLSEAARGYVMLSIMLIVIWAMSGAGYFWPAWPMLGFGLAVFGHGGAGLFRRGPSGS